MEVIIVNHGKQFGHDNWYTFYCPKCNKQLTRSDSPKKCCDCRSEVVWPA